MFRGARRLLPAVQDAVVGQAEQQGWRIKTVVKACQVPGATGHGRFAAEAVEPQRRICVKPMVPVSHLKSLGDAPEDSVLMFEDVDDLEKYVAMSVEEGDTTREQVLAAYERGMFGLDQYGRRACLNTSEWAMNHAETTPAEKEPNVDFAERVLADGTVAIVGETVEHVAPGDELIHDAGNFVLPGFFKDYCKTNSLKGTERLIE